MQPYGPMKQFYQGGGEQEDDSATREKPDLQVDPPGVITDEVEDGVRQ